MKKLLLALCVLLVAQYSTMAQTTEFSDDFESGIGNWTLEGAWGLTTAQSNSPSNSLADSPDGNYAADQNISATLTTGIDLSAALDAELKFSAIYDIENGNFDYCYVEASGDGGTTWLNVATIFGEGNLSPWQDYTYSLGGFAGSSDVKIRFRFFSDGGYEVDGIYIDDVEIISSDVDNAAPLVLHDPPAFYESSAGAVTMVADLIDISGIGSATLFYSVNGGVAESVTGTVTSDPTYAFVIPEQTTGAQVDYFLEVIDASTNTNTTSTPTFSYIAGDHIFYDNAGVNFVNTFGPDAASNLIGCAVRFSLLGNDVRYALIRNYTDSNRPNDDFEFHIWANDNGLPGADLITPFMVTPEATLTNNSPMTRVDLSAFAAELSAINGDVFMGYTVPTGQTWLVQTTPAVGGRTYTFDGTDWAANPGDDYHFRLVTSPAMAADDCAMATNLNGLIGGAVDVPQTSPMFNNNDATVGANDPTTGFECWGEPDGGGATPSIENSQWYTFTGDGETYFITTTDCNGTTTDFIDFGDTQVAIYSGADCDNLTAVACNEDAPGVDPNGPYPFGLEFETEAGVVYYMMIDGFGGSDGEYCVEFTQIVSITCADINLNDATIATNDVCFGATTDITLTGTVIPGDPTNGFVWGIFTEDVSGSTDPFNEASILGFFGVSLTEYAPALLNDGTQVPAGTYYFAPVVYGGGVDTVGGGLLSGFDFTDGCLITGNALEINLLADLDDLSAATTFVDEIVPPGSNGEASVSSVTGGSGNVTYLWSNNETTATITGLTAGDYMVTISDATGCVDDIIETVTVDMIVSAEELAFDQSLRLFPNPATKMTSLQYSFGQSTDLQISVTNSIGEVVLSKNVEGVIAGNIELDLQNLADGVYFVELNDGAHQAIRRLVVSK